ncbi:hypothetical protein OCU04_004085 [Sclerotinia nivalis]|uniref:Uncharacterized protein n=1 Tax=Sclerotinia nivalis TaxID=352851 RepID=A0A9X0DND5_9HELO|nr:hypothetical protein OCU04_004085 [Sclerotinia nivalis]
MVVIHTASINPTRLLLRHIYTTSFLRPETALRGEGYWGSPPAVAEVLEEAEPTTAREAESPSERRRIQRGIGAARAQAADYEDDLVAKENLQALEQGNARFTAFGKKKMDEKAALQ